MNNHVTKTDDMVFTIEKIVCLPNLSMCRKVVKTRDDDGVATDEERTSVSKKKKKIGEEKEEDDARAAAATASASTEAVQTLSERAS